MGQLDRDIFLACPKSNSRMASENKTQQPANANKSTFTTKLVCGAIAGVIGTSIIFPLDIIKTRLQNQKPVGPSKTLAYSGM